MDRRWFALAIVATSGLGGWAAGCGDDEVYESEPPLEIDAGPVDGSGAVDASDAAPSGPTCGDAGGVPSRLLLSINRVADTEVAAFNLVTHAVDGRIAFPSSLGTTATTGPDPYFLSQANDLVFRLDLREPWRAVSSWNVGAEDAPDSGGANPVGVVVPACDKGYVLRYKRNKIAVIDTTSVADGGAPASFLDLSSLLQPNDKDGLVDMTSAVFVPSRNRIYVLLANFDFTKIAPDGYTALCPDTTSTIVAIDATSGQLVSLGGTGPGGGIALGGTNPLVGAPLVHDPVADRLIVLSAGCNVEEDGGTAGPIARRRVEEVSLATGQVKTLLDLDAAGFPIGLAFVDGHRAAIALNDGAYVPHTYFWDPSQPTIGAEIPDGPTYFAHDGKGALVGARATVVDGGPAVDLLATPFTDAGTVDASAVTKIGTDPFQSNAGFLSGAEVWPRP